MGLVALSGFLLLFEGYIASDVGKFPASEAIFFEFLLYGRHKMKVVNILCNSNVSLELCCFDRVTCKIAIKMTFSR